MIIGSVFLYLWFLKDPSVENSFKTRAFKMSAEALNNSVHLANMKYISQKESFKQIDVWVEKEIGLDFNSAGFPVGTNLLNQQVDLPITLSQCIEVWKFLFGGMQPIESKPNKKQFWATTDKQSVCRYLNSAITDKQIVYDTTNGLVTVEEAQINVLNN